MDLSISQAHANCVSVFLTLIEASHSPSHKELLNEAQDVFDRYKLWAGNVGAIHGTNPFIGIEVDAGPAKLCKKFEFRYHSLCLLQYLKLRTTTN